MGLTIGNYIGIGKNSGISLSQYWAKQNTGLIFKTDFDSLAGWTNDGTFSSIADDALISFNQLPPIFYPTSGGVDQTGVREATVYKENGILYLIYDGGDNSTGWYNHWAQSDDGGLTWIKKGIFGPNHEKGTGGNYAAVGMGWLCKIGSTYYLYRLTANSVSTGVYIDVANIPYHGDIWHSSSLSGPWTFDMDIPVYAGTWANTETYPSSLIKIGSIYYFFIGAINTTGQPHRTNGILTSSTPVGPWTQVATATLTEAILGDSRTPENPKTFYHPVLGKYCCISNLVNAANSFTDQNCIQISSTITDFATSSLRRIHGNTNMDGIKPVGAPSPIMESENSVVIGNNDFIPIMYDCEGTVKGTPNPADYHVGRIIRTVLLEPSRYTLRFDGSASGKIYKTLANSNFIADFGVQFSTYEASKSLGIIYRSDGSGNNEYRLKVQNGGGKLLLTKVVSGSESIVATGSGSLLTTLGMINRIQIKVNGSLHQAWINGELQISVTDTSFATGTNIGLYGASAVSGDIRLLSMRSNNIVTITDLPAWTKIDLLADGGVGAYSTYTNQNGTATFALDHWPMDAFRVNGIIYTIDGGIYGGDTFSFSNLSLPAYTGDDLNTLFLSVVNDGNTKGWYDSQDLTTITKDGSNLVSRWNDKLLSGNDLIQATSTKQPLWSSSGITFDGVDNAIKGTFTFNQPNFIYMVFKQITWVNGDVILDGSAGVYNLLQQTAVSPEVKAYGDFYSNGSADVPLNTFVIVRLLFNGANSKLIVNNNPPITGNFGLNNMGGLTLGATKAVSGLYGNIQVKEVILRNATEIGTNKEEIIYQWLKDKYSL